MKRFLLFTFIFIMFPATAISKDILPLVWSTTMPVTDSVKPNYNDDRDYENFVGRLYIDDVNIDVALYHGSQQTIVDRNDSAAYFDVSNSGRYMLIADHNTEAFAPLGTVKVGEIARIVKEDGTIVYYECIDVFKGYNTGTGMTDMNGKSVLNQEDLLMYTCYNGWKNIWITLWSETLPPEKKERRDAMNRFITSVENLLGEMLSTMHDNPVEVTSESEEIELTLD